MKQLIDFATASRLYEEAKKILFQECTNIFFEYNKKELLKDRDVAQNIKDQYYDESGKIIFENNNGNNITIEIQRWHTYKRWSAHGFYEEPSYKVTIFVEDNIIWELKCYADQISVNQIFIENYSPSKEESLELPNDILIPKEKAKKEEVQDKISTQVTPEPEIVLDTRILLEELKNRRNQYDMAIKTKESILQERKQAIEKAIEKIMLAYSSRLNASDEKINETHTELNEYDNLISIYSTFDADMIGSALEQLISIIESKSYSYKEVTHRFNRRVHGPIDSWDEEAKTNVKIIVDKSKYLAEYSSSYQSDSILDKLALQGSAIILSENSVYSPKVNAITFYTSKNGQLVCPANFGRFDYIKDFIDKVIQYRFERGLKDFTKDDLLICMQEFLNNNRTTIINNCVAKVEQKILSFKL